MQNTLKGQYMLGEPYASFNNCTSLKQPILLDFGCQLFLSNGVYYVPLQVQLNCISKEF